MEAVFKNVPAPVLASVRASIEGWWKHDHYCPCGGGITAEGFCGDCGSSAVMYPHINPNQRVSIRGDMVFIEGERCALWSDGHWLAMHALHNAGLKPAKYVTSDPCLEWHETLHSHMCKVYEMWGIRTEAQAAAMLNPEELAQYRRMVQYFQTRGITRKTKAEA